MAASCTGLGRTNPAFLEGKLHLQQRKMKTFHELSAISVDTYDSIASFKLVLLDDENSLGSVVKSNRLVSTFPANRKNFLLLHIAES